MAELMSVHGWAYPPLRTPPGSQEPGHKRVSHSTDGRAKPPPGKTVFRTKSSNALTDMATVTSAFRPSPSLREESSGLNTIKDPRAASTSDLSSTTTTSGSSPRHPELSNEVATLSDKLIQAINNQTILDDTLSGTRQELEAARARVDKLEQENRQHKDDLDSGRLVKKGEVEIELSQLRETAEDERMKRLVMEKEKKGIELELENLTAALFDEANKMVVAAKKEREAVERKNELLRAQVKDTEMLVASNQEQLVELKSTMQQMHSDRDDADTRTNPSTAPASPATANTQHESISRLLEAMNLSPTSTGTPDISPAPSTSFAHLIKSVCRTDVNAYDDFRALLHQAKSSRAHSRAGSGSYGGFNVMGLSNFTSNSPSPQPQPQTNGVGAASNKLAQASSYPNGLTSSPRDSISSSIPLKETKFYKRVLTEDIEPTLRLDTAPGISWLTRRSVLSSICEGGLIIEPIPSATQKYTLPCSLCGERRKGDENLRTHRFRTSDNESAQRYQLCTVCLERMRATCDFVGYLRLIADSHVRVEDAEDERESWEETVRHRERMFWSRIGGGVVPAFVQRKEREMPEDTLVNGNGTIGHEAPSACAQGSENHLNLEDTGKDKDPFSSKVERASIGNTVISINGQIEMSPSHTPQKEEEIKDLDAIGKDETVTDTTRKDEEMKDADSKEKDEPLTHTVDKEEETKSSDSITKDEPATDTVRPTTNGDMQAEVTVSTSQATHAESDSIASVTSSKSANGVESA